MRHPAFLLLLVASLWMSCKPKPTDGPVQDDSDNAAEVLKKTYDSELPWETLELRGTVDVESPEQNVSVTYRIRLKKEELLWASISKFGFDAARVLVREDTVFVRNYLQKQGMVCGLGFLGQKIGLAPDLGAMQDILLGNFITPEDPKKVKYLEDKGPQVHLESLLDPYRLHWQLDPGHYRVTQLRAEDSKGDEATRVEYGDFQNVNGFQLPHEIRIQVSNPKPMTLVMEHSKVIIGLEEKDFRFSIPESYEMSSCQ